LTEQGPKPEETPFTRHLHEAFEQAGKALRCHAAFLSSTAGRLTRRLLRVLAFGVAALALALIGVFFAAFGLAEWIEGVFNLPNGAGLFCVGVLVLIGALMCVLGMKRRGGA